LALALVQAVAVVRLTPLLLATAAMAAYREAVAAVVDQLQAVRPLALAVMAVAARYG
jgi:hypothetical protein